MTRKPTATMLVDKWTGVVTIRIKGLGATERGIMTWRGVKFSVKLEVHGDDPQASFDTFHLCHVAIEDESIGHAANLPVPPTTTDVTQKSAPTAPWLAPTDK